MGTFRKPHFITALRRLEVLLIGLLGYEELRPTRSQTMAPTVIFPFHMTGGVLKLIWFPENSKNLKDSLMGIGLMVSSRKLAVDFMGLTKLQEG